MKNKKTKNVQYDKKNYKIEINVLFITNSKGLS